CCRMAFRSPSALSLTSSGWECWYESPTNETNRAIFESYNDSDGWLNCVAHSAVAIHGESTVAETEDAPIVPVVPKKPAWGIRGGVRAGCPDIRLVCVWDGRIRPHGHGSTGLDQRLTRRGASSSPRRGDPKFRADRCSELFNQCLDQQPERPNRC